MLFRVALLLVAVVCGAWVPGIAAQSAAEPPAAEVSHKIDADTWRKVRDGTVGELIVEFRDPAVADAIQADLTQRGLRKMDAVALRRKGEHYRQLKTRNLSALLPGDAEQVRDYSHLPLSLLHVRGAAALQRLLARPEVVAAYENRRALPASATLDLIGQVQASQVLGQTGAGATVVVLDTGVDYTLANFGSCPDPLPAVPPASCKVAAAFDLTLAYGTFPYPPVLTVPPFYPPYDDGSKDNLGHGTGVAATLLSAASNARIVAIDVMNEPPWSDFTGATSDSILAGINWAIVNQTNYNIVAINISLAGGQAFAAPCAANNPLSTPVQEARDQHGILTVAASGNDNTADGLPWPSCTPGVISVGAVYDSNTATCTPGLKDTVVCGANVASYLSLLTPAGATSFAAPLAAGAAAVLAAAYPNETPATRALRMTSTGKPVRDNRVNGLGYVIPRLDMVAALLYPGTTPPANNNFAAAGVLGGNSGTTLGWNFQATRESGEPLHAGGGGGASLWWRWTASTSGTMTLDTHGSNIDTLLNVYNGSTLSTLSNIAANDNDGGDGGVSGLSFHADAGTTYYFAIDGKAGATGDLYLNRTFSADAATTTNLSVSVSAAPTPPTVGAMLTYTLTIRNSGPAAGANVTLTHTLPGGTSFISADADCTHNNGTVSCALGNVAAAGQTSRVVRVMVNATGTLTSQTQITSTTTDGNPANNIATSAIAVDSGADVPLPGWALALLAGALLTAAQRINIKFNQ